MLLVVCQYANEYPQPIPQPQTNCDIDPSPNFLPIQSVLFLMLSEGRGFCSMLRSKFCQPSLERIGVGLLCRYPDGAEGMMGTARGSNIIESNYP